MRGMCFEFLEGAEDMANAIHTRTTHVGLFGDDDGDEDWITGSTASKSHTQSDKKPHPSIGSSGGGLFSELGGGEDDEVGGLFDEPSTKTPAPESSSKKKVNDLL